MIIHRGFCYGGDEGKEEQRGMVVGYHPMEGKGSLVLLGGRSQQVWEH